VLATVVNLLETTLIRVGNKDYAKDNGSYGLTTLRSRHVAVASSELRFNFKGKSGKTWRLQVKDRRVARVVKACQELPGQHLFQYIDRDSESQAVTSSDVNDYFARSPAPQKTSVPGQDCTGGDGTLGI
jgi:DNA topoisomerase I